MGQAVKGRITSNLHYLDIYNILLFHHFMANRRGNDGNSDRLIFLGSKITVEGNCSHEIKRHLLLGMKDMTNLVQHIKKQRHYFVNKGPYSQSYGFSSIKCMYVTVRP